MIDSSFQSPPRSLVAATKVGELFLIAGETDRAAERERLDKEIAKLEAELKTTEAKLANESFVVKAAPVAVQRERDRLATLREQKDKIQALLVKLV